MSNGLTFGVLAVLGSNSRRCWTHFGLDLQRRNCNGKIAHTHQIVGRAGEGEDPIHLAHATMANLAHQGNRLQPAEALFDALPLLLADGVPGCRVVRASIALPPRRS